MDARTNVVIAKLYTSKMFTRGLTDSKTGYSEDEHGEFETTGSRAKNELNGLLRRVKRTWIHFT